MKKAAPPIRKGSLLIDFSRIRYSIIARITAGNNISIKLHESVGFKVIGVMKEIGYKFGKRLDVYFMQKIY